MTSSAAGHDSADGVAKDLASGCTSDDIEEGDNYVATVNGIVEYGVFVDLSENVSGLVHESKLDNTYEVGDELVVELVEIRENGDLGFDEVAVDPEAVDRTDVSHGERVEIGALDDRTGDAVYVEGDVVQIKQTAGPTVFSLRDGTGIVPCAAFEEAGVRAYPEIELDDTLRVAGTVEAHEDAPQLEVETLTALEETELTAARERIDETVDAAATPADPEPLIEWPAFDALRDDLASVARSLRQAVLDGRPIRVRHHADGDGMCAALPVQLALENFIADVHADPDAPRHLFKRLPSKAPYYEMEDVTRTSTSPWRTRPDTASDSRFCSWWTTARRRRTRRPTGRSHSTTSRSSPSTTTTRTRMRSVRCSRNTSTPTSTARTTGSRPG